MIYLIGYMGVGKTTIAKQLAKQKGLLYTDTDSAIAIKTAKSIKSLFENEGEKHFRNLEKELLQQLKGNQIIACGGGLPIFNNNMELINTNGVSIYLKASAKTLAKRLRAGTKNRPLLSSIAEDDLEAFIEQQLKVRSAFYTKAKYTIEVDNKDEKQVLREVNALVFSS